ncbi:Hypothetical predicted protein, partial [Paramuricea clavata]
MQIKRAEAKQEEIQAPVLYKLDVTHFGHVISKDRISTCLSLLMCNRLGAYCSQQPVQVHSTAKHHRKPLR